MFASEINFLKKINDQPVLEGVLACFNFFKPIIKEYLNRGKEQEVKKLNSIIDELNKRVNNLQHEMIRGKDECNS